MTALKTLKSTLVPEQRLKSPTAVMRAVLAKVRDQEKQAGNLAVLQQLSELLGVSTRTLVPTVTR